MRKVVEALIQEEQWKTMHGAHILVDGGGNILAGGPKEMRKKNVSKKEIKDAVKNANSASKSKSKEKSKSKKSSVKINPLPENPKSVNWRSFSTLSKCVKSSGGSKYESVDTDTDCYSYPKGTTRKDVCVGILNTLREQGFDARFVGKSGSYLSDNSGKFSNTIDVRDRKREQGIEIKIYDTDYDSNDGEYFDVEMIGWG